MRLMDKIFWKKMKEHWIHEESAQESQQIDDALCIIESIIAKNSESQYSKNFLNDEE